MQLKRVVALAGSAVVLSGAGLAASPVALAAAHVTPTVTSVSLTSSETKVTSSTNHSLRVEVGATQESALPSGDGVSVSLSTGTSTTSEVHLWNFPVDASALTVDSTGAGTLNVPPSEITPFGVIDLTITPVGNPTTQNCNGQPVSQTQNVSLSGTFFFDSKSTGTHKWGTVGSKTKPFTFSATNKLISSYGNGAAFGCINLNNLPCTSGVFWEAQQGSVDFEGYQSGTTAGVRASRNSQLTTPTGATRDDETFGTTKTLTIKTKAGGGASLAVAAKTNSVGSTALSASKKGQPYSQHCKSAGKTKNETSTTWNNAKYANGKVAFVVHEQIYGSLKVANNTQSTLSKTVIS